MKRMKKVLISSLCVAAMGAAIVPVAASVWSGNAADTPTWNEINLEENYVRDDKIVIPERSVTVNGNTYNATIKVEYPDGSVQKVSGGEFNLAQPGQYTLIYEAQDANYQKYTDEVDFLVANKLWSVGNPASKVEYGKVGNTNALMVTLMKNDKLTFNRIVDLTDLKSTDTLMRAFINPAMPGTFEFDKFAVTLTDVTDPTQQLTIRGTRSTTNNERFVSYWASAGPNQTIGGWDQNTNGGLGAFSTTAPDGIRGRAITNASFYSQNGTYGSQYPTGCDWWDVVADQCSFDISYDRYDVKTLVNGLWVADHDNGEYYETEPLWLGFPSNKVFVSVEAQDCSGESGSFCISKLYGYDFTDENVFVENDAPSITVDVDEKYVAYENGAHTMLPLAVVGGNYPVPAATAFDEYSGYINVERKVYHNYASETHRLERSIKNDSFLVNKTGKYAIVYSATDAMGNVTEEIYWINAVSALDNPLALTVDMTDVKLSASCGESVKVAPYSTTGGSGDVTVTVTASCGDTVIDVTNGYFIPEQAGTWTVKCTAKDFAGVVEEKSYEVTVTIGEKPVFSIAPVFPKYYVSDIAYRVPVVKAYQYTEEGKQEVVADMILKDANGETTYKVGDKFTPVTTAEKPEITLVFTAGGATYEKTIPTVQPVVKDGKRTFIYIEKMFTGEGFTAERTGAGLKVLAEEAGDFKWTFANAIVADNASVTIKGMQGNSNFDAMKVTYTDYADDSISVTMYVENQANGFLRAKFGDLNRETTKGFNMGSDAAGNAMDTFLFSYKYGAFYVDSHSANVTKDDSGKAFNGFPSGRVYISVETINAKSGAGYYVKQFDNHIINTGTADRALPRIGITGEYGGMFDVNSVYTLTPAIASDTIDASVYATFTVRTPSGKIATDVNGMELKDVSADESYQMKLTEYGQYLVTYTSTDCNGRTGSTNYAVNVFDRKAPKASLAETWSPTAKVGETVILPEIYVSDDASSVAEMKVIRYVRNPYGVATPFGYDYVVKEDGSIVYYQYKFTFARAGKYTFVNVVYDAAGNQKLVEYVVMVEEADASDAVEA